MLPTARPVIWVGVLAIGCLLKIGASSAQAQALASGPGLRLPGPGLLLPRPTLLHPGPGLLLPGLHLRLSAPPL